LGRLGTAGLLVGGLSLFTGCETKSFLDPGQIGRWETKPLVVPILDNLNIGADELDAQFTTARDIEQADLTDDAADYEIAANDTVSVSITDLVAPGAESTKTIRVSQTGKISLPLLPSPIQASGLSEQQLERAVTEAYKDAQVIQNAQVTVSVLEARGRTYSVIGAVGNPGLYAIYDTDFRVLDALVTARDVTSAVGIDTIYVIRKKTAAKTESAPVAPAAPATGTDSLAPQSMAPSNANARTSQMLMQDGKAPEGSTVVIDGKEIVITPPPAATNPMEMSAEAPATQPGGIVTSDAPMATTQGGMEPKFEFNAIKEPDDREIIRVPYAALKSGQLKYNIIIKPGDLLFVPSTIVGEYYMGGNVQGPGAYSLSARKITLMQALVAARGLNDVAWPSRTEIVRRLPGDKQVFVRVDLDKIASGLEPDLYLKPDDRINVGTNAIAPFLASFRNGFRLTYGFGFLFDRNFANNDNNNNNNNN